MILYSGLDITLIDTKLLQPLKDPPKPQEGQRISLLQVSSFVDNFVSVPMLVPPKDRPVFLDVKAYIVKNMNAPFLLGNGQYGLSLIREEEGSFVVLGNSGRRIQIVDRHEWCPG